MFRSGINAMNSDADSKGRILTATAAFVQVLVRMRPALEHEVGSAEAELHMCHETNVISMTHFGRWVACTPRQQETK